MKFIVLSEEEEDDLIQRINSYYSVVMYKIVKNGLCSGIWKRVSRNPDDCRYVYLNLRFHKVKNIQIDKKKLNRLSICISSDFENVAIVLWSSGVKNVLYFPSALTPDWMYFWKSFRNECVEIRNAIIASYIFNRSIYCDPLKKIHFYLVPKWSLRIINIFRKKNW